MKPLYFFIALFLLTIFSVLQCSDKSTETSTVDPGTVSPADITAIDKSLAGADNKFGFNLFQAILDESDGGNVFISPLSVAMALTMTYNGADGATRDAMQTALVLNGLTIDEVNQSYRNLINVLTGIDPSVTFNIANSIWYRMGLPVRQSFLDINADYFDAEVNEVDFLDAQTPGLINGWVDDKTNGKISKIVGENIPGNMAMMLIDAIYFKGAWSDKFNSDSTVEDEFSIDDHTQVACDMMMKHTSYDYLWTPKYQAVRLPYGDSAFNMLAVLPGDNSNIDVLCGQFDEDFWKNTISSLRKSELTLGFPKFKIAYENSLVDELTAMGMGIAFGPGADFSGITDGHPLVISDVKHKTFIEVNEEGTEAAAVTSVVMTDSVPPIVIFDRPFLLAIYEKHSGAIIFVGRIADPSDES